MRVRSSVAAVAVIALAATNARAQTDFDTGRVFPAAGDGECLAVADVDEDGWLDLIVRGGSGLLVHSLRGPFAAPAPSIEWPLPATPRKLAAGDVDADGHVDVVVAFGRTTAAIDIGVLFGDGRGGVTLASAASTTGSVRAIELLDADGDSLLDFVAAFQGSRTIVLALQDRTSPRSFLPPSLALSGVSNARLAPGDFNGDGSADVAAIGDGPPRLELLLGDGAGALTSSRSFSLTNTPGSIVAADFDRDGFDDVVATEGRLFSLRGDALSGLVPAWVGPNEPRAVVLTAGDLDGDGFADVVGAGNGVISRWRNDGTGRFVPTTSFSLRDDRTLAVADVDGDGIADVVGARPLRGSVDVLTRTASGGFLMPFELDAEMLGSGDAADFDGDGTVDLVLGGRSPSFGIAHLFFGDGSGGFRSRSEERLPVFPSSVLAADVLLDALPDLVITSAIPATVTVLLNAGGTFTDLGTMNVLGVSVSTAVGDFDGDAAVDFVTGNHSGTTCVVGFGDGAGAFSVRSVVVGARQGVVAAGDVDADGFADAVFTTTDPAGLVLAFGAASRSFVVGTPIAVGPEPQDVIVADFDLDGRLDVAVADLTEPVVRVLFGDGARGFPRTHWIVTPLPASSLTFGDATGDGLPDLVVGHVVTSAVSVLAGDGRGEFRPAAASFYAPGGVERAFATDFGEDGAPEIVVPGRGFKGSVLRSRETPLATALRGTVDAGRGFARDVLFVNSLSGGASRTVRLGPGDPLSITVARPPLVAGLAAFAMYAWPVAPTPSTVRALPAGLGSIALPMPLAPGSPGPRAIWNNVGRTRALGAPTRPSSPAPTTLLGAPAGAGRAITFTLQGLIVDPGALNRRAAVTNGVVVEIR